VVAKKYIGPISYSSSIR